MHFKLSYIYAEHFAIDIQQVSLYIHYLVDQVDHGRNRDPLPGMYTTIYVYSLPGMTGTDLQKY